MVRSTLFAALAMILCFSNANGLKCYDCIYMTDEKGQPVPGFNDDSSCASGNTPNNTLYLIGCSGSRSGVGRQMNPTSNDDGIVVMFNRSIDITADISPMEVTNWGCQKVYVEGNRAGRKHQMTIRSCVSSYVEFPEGCSKRKLKDWRKKDSQWALLVSSEAASFDSEAQVTGCYCTGDKCNSAMMTNAVVGPQSLIIIIIIGSTLLPYTFKM